MLALEPESIISGQRIIAYVKMLYCLIDMLANLAGLFVRRSGECSLPTTIIISWLSEGAQITNSQVCDDAGKGLAVALHRKHVVFTVEEGHCFVLPWSTFKIAGQCLQFPVTNVNQKFRLLMTLKMRLALSTVSPISLHRRFRRCCLRDTRDSPFALSAAYMPSLLQTCSWTRSINSFLAWRFFLPGSPGCDW